MVQRAVFVLAAVLAGCSSGYSSGVAGDRPFQSLTPVEGQTACENLSAYLTGLFPPAHAEQWACLVGAYLTTLDPASCDASVTACIARDFDNPFDVDCSSPYLDPTCRATVGQAEACITADSIAHQAWLAEVRAAGCSVAGNLPELTRLGRRPDVPSECSVLASICPTLGNGFVPR